MPTQTPEQKADRRLLKVFMALVNRREFPAAAASIGLAACAITKPQDLAAASATWDEAVGLGYLAFWGGANASVEEGPSPQLTPIDISKMYTGAKAYNGDQNNPNDGHDGPNQKGKPHKPKSGLNVGPTTAREWLMWRVLAKFKVYENEWGVRAGYALSNCARMGSIARRLADIDDPTKPLMWVHVFDAFYRVRDNPVVHAKLNPRNELCE